MTTRKAIRKAKPPPDTQAPSPQDHLQLDRFLPYRLSVVANRVSRAIAQIYEREFDLSIPEWRVMAVLAQRPGITATQLVAATAMDKVAISRAVKRLGAMSRVFALTDESDARRQRLRLTTKGEALYRRIAPQALTYESQLLEILGPAAARDLDDALDCLLRALPEA
ncbi:MAG: MarR family winged helix-turn-helix transcriptional regulator [Caulobacterales bacterium]|jgi:DNA-binding MarR family transcriptional regulator